MWYLIDCLNIQKLAVGDLPEKIITAFQVVHDENTNEKAALNKCKDALSHFKEMEKDIANISSHGKNSISFHNEFILHLNLLWLSFNVF